MEVQSPENLLLQNKPEQIVILEELLALFSQSPYLSHAFVRGSITSNALDRASDLDLVLAFDGDYYIKAIESLDSLMAENLNSIFPGWADTIVADFGGLGFVYIIERGGALFQVDLYIMPSHQANQLSTKAKAKLVFKRDDAKQIDQSNGFCEITEYIKNFRIKSRQPKDFFVGAMVLALLVRKRIKRGQVFLNYSETHLLNIEIRNLFRSKIDPNFVSYGWYHIQERFVISAEGEEQLNFLESLIRGEAVHTAQSLKDTMIEFLKRVRDLAPEIFQDLQKQIHCFYSQCGFLKGREKEEFWNQN